MHPSYITNKTLAKDWKKKRKETIATTIIRVRILLSYNFTSKTWEELMTQDADIPSLFSNSFKSVYQKINACKSMQFLQSFHQNTYQFEAATDRRCLSFFSHQQSLHQRKNHLDVSSALEKLNWKVLKTKRKTKNKVNFSLLLLTYITKLTWCPEIVALAPCPMVTMTKNCSSRNVVIIKIFLLDTSRMKNTKSHKAPVT